MRLPASALTKLCLAGAVATLGGVMACEKAKPAVVIEEEVEMAPTAVERITPIPSYTYAKPAVAPKRVVPPPASKPFVKTTTPKLIPKPAFSAHACGPCGMG